MTGGVGFIITVRVADSTAGAPLTATKAFALTVMVPLEITTTNPLPAATQGQPYSQPLTASGGTAPYTWSSDTLPADLTLSPTGVLSGAPTATGSYSFTVTAKDATPATPLTTTKTFALTVNSGPLEITTPSPLPLATMWQSYSETLTATGGTPPYTWSLGGNPPAGLMLSSTTGVLSGTPTSQTTYPITVTVKDATPATPLTTTKNFLLTVGFLPPEITTSSPLPPATLGQQYSQSLTAIGGKAPYTTWSVVVGSLPSGLALSTSGVLSGTPTATVANQGFIVKVTDSTPGTPLPATKNFTLSVDAPHVLVTTPSPLPHAIVGQLYSQTLTATGGTPPYTWSFFAAPVNSAWLTLSPTGVLQGTPTGGNANLFNYHPNFVVKVTDSTPGTPLATYASFALAVYAAGSN
jgi:hypothetical protein